MRSDVPCHGWLGVPGHFTTSALLFVSSLSLVFQAVADPHRSVSADVDPSEYAESPTTAFAAAERAAFEVDGGISDEALFGSGAFEGTGAVGEGELLAAGVIAVGTSGTLSEAELDRLLSLPVVEGDIRPEVILGDDTRSRLYTTSYPARAVVLITFDDGRCSGFMIGPDTVATAGHCLHWGGAWRTGVTVWPGHNGGSAPFGKCTARALYSVTGWTNNSDPNQDYGAIKLDCAIGNTTGWFGFRTGAVHNRPSIITGYPADKPLEMWQSADKVRGATTHQLFYASDTVGGMSGSPVWEDWWRADLSLGAYAMGIHGYGPSGTGLRGTYNYGTRISPAVFRNLMAWKNANPRR
jgi:glutamyl endopeptidase